MNRILTHQKSNALYGAVLFIIDFAVTGNIICWKYAKDIFNEFLKVVSKYVSGDIANDSSDWTKEDDFNEIDKLIDINSDKTSFVKAPGHQEASVAGIFYECMGRGLIKDIIPLTSGYRNKYDLYAVWNGRKIVVEFKSQLRNLIRDFSDARKMFNDMDCVVCWEVTSDDIQAMRNIAVAVTEIEENEFTGTANSAIPHSTHVMRISNVRPLYVIDLKKIIMS